MEHRTPWVLTGAALAVLWAQGVPMALTAPLAQVPMSATYPLEIVQAACWRKKNEALQGEALDAA
jgi:hypothetical protein